MSDPVILPVWTPIQLVQNDWPIGQSLYAQVKYVPPPGEQFTQSEIDAMMTSRCEINLYRNKPGPTPLGEIHWKFTLDPDGVVLHLYMPPETAAALVKSPSVNYGRVMRSWMDGTVPRTRCDVEIRIYATYDSQLNEGFTP